MTQQPQQPQPDLGDTAKKTGVVLLTLFVICIGGPVLICAGFVVLSRIFGN